MIENPFSEMVSLLDRRSREHADRAVDQSWLGAELGTVNGDLSITLDCFKHPIRDYLLAHYMTLTEPDFTHTETGCSHCAHGHGVVTPEPLKPLHPGNRVLVLPVNAGQDFVIVARVVPRL